MVAWRGAVADQINEKSFFDIERDKQGRRKRQVMRLKQ